MHVNVTHSSGLSAAADVGSGFATEASADGLTGPDASMNIDAAVQELVDPNRARGNGFASGSSTSEPAPDSRAADNATDAIHVDPKASDDSPQDQSGMPTREAFAALVKTANAGDPQALVELRELLDRCPQIWQHVGNLAAIAEATLVDLVAGSDHLAAESLRRSITEMKNRLSRPGADYLDELAVGRVVACWLSLQHCETALTRSEAGTAQAAFWLKRQAQADRAYHAAMRSLTTIRNLLPLVATQTPQQASAPVAAPTSTVEAGQCDGATIPIAPYLDTAPVDQMAGTRAAGQ